jgi:hypothetical protein
LGVSTAYEVYFIRHIVPLKMDLTEGSETSAKLNLTPWRHPIEHMHDSEHGENLKSRIKVISFAEQFGNRAAQREFGILESNVLYWGKQKELFKKCKT